MTERKIQRVKGLVHARRQNRELMSIDKVLRLFVDELQVWTRDKKVLDHVGFVPQLSKDYRQTRRSVYRQWPTLSTSVNKAFYMYMQNDRMSTRGVTAYGGKGRGGLPGVDCFVNSFSNTYP